MINLIGAGAICFTAIFLSQGGGITIKEAVLALPLGKWGVFALIMVVLLILGMFMDWMGIIMILLPIYQPIIAALGMDPLWFAVLVCVNLQMSFLTPPFGYALFYLKAVSPKGVEMTNIMRSIVPFLALIIVGIVVVAIYPDIALWLPSVMVK
jgi:TRAP-type mannitol/chloroaromatic compound transport system permease large subunit